MDDSNGKDTSVKVDKVTHARLKALAGDKPLKEFLADLAMREEQQRALDTATEAFRRVLTPDVLARFDADFGGLPPVVHQPPQAA
ncbi:antitoxin MazE7 [Streptomyces sp. NPDC008001]|uniref:antitoxin MazE7 n=1 Tax=Streptomyces sp. NPDC008001 TaxID=3364804 RepID=UPI0036E75C6F